MDRRDFFSRAVLGASAVLLAPQLVAQEQDAAAQQGSGSSNMGPMQQDAAKSVRRPAKPGAGASMTEEERDDLEHEIRCQCGCTLDVYTCRTTDFACQVSPAMHRDVMSLVAGGYSASEILDAFVETYGERALMAPKREGFNWAGYLVPFAALSIGAVALLAVLRGMQRRAAAIPAASAAAASAPDATAEEMARLEAAVRRDV